MTVSYRRLEHIVHIAIFVLPGTHLHLSETKYVRVKCLAQEHNIEPKSICGDRRNMTFR